MIIFPDFRRILGKKCKVYIKLTIIQGKNSKLKGEKLKTQVKTQNSSKKLKVSAKSKTRFAKNWSKKKADLGTRTNLFGCNATDRRLEL